jgi:hypothetical protein
MDVVNGRCRALAWSGTSRRHDDLVCAESTSVGCQRALNLKLVRMRGSHPLNQQVTAAVSARRSRISISSGRRIHRLNPRAYTSLCYKCQRFQECSDSLRSLVSPIDWTWLLLSANCRRVRIARISFSFSGAFLTDQASRVLGACRLGCDVIRFHEVLPSLGERNLILLRLKKQLERTKKPTVCRKD